METTNRYLFILSRFKQSNVRTPALDFGSLVPFTCRPLVGNMTLAARVTNRSRVDRQGRLRYVKG